MRYIYIYIYIYCHTDTKAHQTDITSLMICCNDNCRDRDLSGEEAEVRHKLAQHDFRIPYGRRNSHTRPKDTLPLNHPFLVAVCSNDLQTVKQELAAGWNPNRFYVRKVYYYKRICTALHVAACDGFTEIAQALLDARADPLLSSGTHFTIRYGSNGEDHICPLYAAVCQHLGLHPDGHCDGIFGSDWEVARLESGRPDPQTPSTDLIRGLLQAKANPLAMGFCSRLEYGNDGSHDPGPSPPMSIESAFEVAKKHSAALAGLLLKSAVVKTKEKRWFQPRWFTEEPM